MSSTHSDSSDQLCGNDIMKYRSGSSAVTAHYAVASVGVDAAWTPLQLLKLSVTTMVQHYVRPL